MVHAAQPLNTLRWTFGHVYDISDINIEPTTALGVHGAAIQAGARMRPRRIAERGIGLGPGRPRSNVFGPR